MTEEDWVGCSGENPIREKAGQPPNQPQLSCPECGSSNVVKAGLRYVWDNTTVQRLLCKNCMRRFSNGKLDEGNHLKTFDTISSDCRVSNDPLWGASGTRQVQQYLATVETRQEKPTREGTTPTSTADAKGKIVEFHWWMLKQGYDEGTAKNRAYLINRLAVLGADIRDPESVKELLAKMKWGDGYKANYVEAYNSLLQMEGRKWGPPRYKRPQNLSFIPTEAEIDAVIAAAGRVTGAFLQGLKDTGADPGELGRVKWTDIDREAKTVKINRPVKGHNARILRVSDLFLSRISALPKKHETIFRYKHMAANFWGQRSRIAQKLQNPRILEIHFTTFRHWKGTMEYHRTKDVLYVQKLLGHKSLQSTMVYIDYETACFGEPSKEEFTVKVAANVEEACKLAEVGFEYVTGEYVDGGKIFRKRK